MPSDNGLLYRPGSPFNAEENISKRDKNFRRYASAVERALSLFDTTLQEWADYISFLGRLSKALQTKPPEVHEIPHSRLVAKRLAQCLSPLLPAGVHQKALDIYAVVFSTLGSEGLSVELPQYLSGLAPLLSFASLTVKPLLLSLFETYIVKIHSKAWRPALKAIILSLLPGLDDPASEEYERTHALLDQFRKALRTSSQGDRTPLEQQDDRFFWQSLFVATISSASRRPGALVYLEKHLPRMGPEASPRKGQLQEEVIRGHGARFKASPALAAVISPEPGLLIRCFAAGLLDEQLLIQRGFLELLVTHLPLNSAVLRYHVTAHDRELLVSAATSVVVRREMSLNRRLWIWFLGQAASPETEHSGTVSPQSENSGARTTTDVVSPVQYFEQFGSDALIEGLLKHFHSQNGTPVTRARPFRMCLSLMDRWEIGGIVLPHVFKSAMESVHQYRLCAPSDESFQEVRKSASSFFDAVQSRLIWKEIAGMVLTAFSKFKDKTLSDEPSSTIAQLELVYFVITSFNIREEEMLNVHIPLLLLLLLHYASNMADISTSVKSHNSIPETSGSLLKSALYLLEQLPDRLFSQDSISAKDTRPAERNIDSLPALISDFYDDTSGKHETSVDSCSKMIQENLLNSSFRLVLACLKCDALASQLNTALSISAKMINKSSSSMRIHDQSMLSHLALALVRAGHSHEDEFSRHAGHISTLELLHTMMPPDLWHKDSTVRQISKTLVHKLWLYISPLQPRHNAEAMRGIWRLHYLSPDPGMVEAAITALLYQSEEGCISQKLELQALRRFTSFWTHTVSMFRSLLNRHSSVVNVASPSNGKSEKLLDDPETIAKPLLLVLDVLRYADTTAYMLVSSWLQTAPDINLLLDLMIKRIWSSPYFTAMTKDRIHDDAGGSAVPDVQAQVAEIVYYLQTSSNLLTAVASRAQGILNANSNHSTPEQNSNTPKLLTEVSSFEPPRDDTPRSIQHHLLQICFVIIAANVSRSPNLSIPSDIDFSCVQLLLQLIPTLSKNCKEAIGLKTLLTKALSRSLENDDSKLQILLIGALKSVFERIDNSNLALQSSDARISSSENSRDQSNKNRASEEVDKTAISDDAAGLDPALLTCLIGGFKTIEDSSVLEHWFYLLDFVLPYYMNSIFQIMLPLVDCLVSSITRVFEDLQACFATEAAGHARGSDPLQTLNLLFNALELILAKGHDQITREEAKKLSLPEPSQGYFGNIVTGLFTAEVQATRPATANDRLSVLLCFRDSVKISYSIWTWGSEGETASNSDLTVSASFNYTSVRLRNRSRRILENLFGVEILECLEVIIELRAKTAIQTSSTVDLLQALEATRPKHTMPSIFNALYSRTNPAVLDAFRQSTLTSDISDVQVAKFLVNYTRSMDDDALDEVWTDCVAFVRDVLANPMPQRQILPFLLEFIAMLGAKIENTNFGEVRRMRREIGELFVRLLAAIFTIKPLSFTFSSNDSSAGIKDRDTPRPVEHEDTIAIISSTLPQMLKILIDTDRINAAATTISLQILNPTFHWKHFPQNLSHEIVNILLILSRVTEVSKMWRKDVAEALNEPRFFAAQSLQLVKTGWQPLLRQWTLADGDRLNEILSRLSFSAAAGMMFGVGASSAKLEADRRAQLNLRRIALLILSADNDKFIPNLKLIEEKLSELLKATASSSPSSTTRAEVYMVLRSLILKTGPEHLTSFYPMISSELYTALSSIGQIASREIYSIVSILQASKLLDTLLLLGPDDFQLKEWLYVTDTVDAVYRPHDWKPVALVDELVEVLDNESSAVHSAQGHFSNDATKKGTLPLLRWDDIRGIPRESLLDQVLRPFLRHLSINAFESMYQMEAVDRDACCEELLKDLFDDSTLV